MDRPDNKSEASTSRIVDDLFSPWAGQRSPGAVVAVTRGGEVVHQGAYGMADLAHGIPLDFKSVIRIASQSKQFTTMLILMLEAEGKLSLDDDVRKHLSWLPEYRHRVTLRHLASNTSGLRDILEMMIFSGVPILSPSSRSFARRMVARHDDFNFPPGGDLLYSNTNFLLLSEILERVSGQSFNALLADRITGPLNMPDTCLMERDDEILPRLAIHHRRGPAGNWLKAAWGNAIGGEGGMVSTGDDMLRWQINLRDPVVGGKTIVGRMAEAGAIVNGVASPYGLGLVTTRDGDRVGIGHGGWIAGARSESVRFPEADLGVMILANHDDLSPFLLARKIAAAILDPSPKTENILPAGMTGTYRDGAGDDYFRIEARDDGPVIVTSMGATPIEPHGKNRFTPKTAIPSFEFMAAPDGSIVAQRFDRSRTFRKIKETAWPRMVWPTTRFGCDTAGFLAEIEPDTDMPRMTLRSAEGILKLTLHRCDADLFLARPSDGEEHDQWRAAPWVLPWLFTVRVGSEGITLNSDRTKGVRLASRPVEAGTT